MVSFSASGIREGYVYELLSPTLRAADGLLSSCQEFASRGGRTVSYAGDLFAWMQPLFSQEDEQSQRLRNAFCLLSDIALHIHPEYRADWAFERMIFSAMTCLSHRERVKLALALYHRYQYKLHADRPELKLISESDKRWARMVGTTANLAYHLSGSIAGNLPDAALRIRSGVISIEFSPRMEQLMGGAVERRLNGLNESYQQFAKQ
jgi:exopolyphosphatase/guanosine-5'-triphosphate,3'-diphosphate pyrophosphatase